MISIAIAGSYEVVKYGIKYLIQELAVDEFRIVDIETKSELEVFLQENPNSVIITDFKLIGQTSVLSLRKRFSQSKWLLLFSDLDEESIITLSTNINLFNAILLSDSVKEIRLALQAVFSGNIYMGAVIREKINQYIEVNEKIHCVLTPSEREILKEIASGKMNKEIAAERNISLHTVVTHRKSIFKKLQVNNVYDATRYAIRSGIITVNEYYI